MKIKVSTVILSNLNDYKIDRNEIRITFVTYLVLNFKDTNQEIEPDVEFQKFCKHREGEHWYGHELAFVSAIVSTHLRANCKKIGEEGIMLHYTLITDIARKFIEKFPLGYDWDQHLANDGNDFDIEVENVTDNYIKENSIQVDHDYFS